ncbi:MAG: DUF4838 domain-containing protein [Clostridia bacterium]|nr:DUF4838 domain-containing protein [Clostridia bacterium]
MKKQICIVLSLLLLFTACIIPVGAADAGLILASDGATDYRIVVGADASPAEQTAANTLADYLEQICGARFDLVTDNASPAAKEIVVGRTNRDADIAIDRGKMDEDAVRIVTNGDKLYLTGGTVRGALYAVYTFLEDWLGCRWFTHKLTVVPEAETIEIPAIDYFYEPCFKQRTTYWSFSTIYADYCAAHKLHGVMAGLSEELGGGRYDLSISSVHTLQQFVPASLFETHPEYFGCDENGEHKINRQPCLHNADVFALAVAWAKNYFSQYNAILSVSQNDNQDFCQCGECRAFNKAHGGTDSASMLDFVNRVADEVRKDYPDARFETLAYQNSLMPPTGLEVGEDIVIRLCPISTCTLHALDDASCPANSKFNKALSGWAELTDNIYIWEYSTDFQYFYALYPNLTAMQGRYRYYRDRSVTAIFDHGCGDIIDPGEFHELRTYLVLKLLWDPDTDIERHMKEFCASYYGAAGEDVVEFIHYFEKNVGGFNPKTFRKCHNSCFDGGVSLVNNTSLSGINVKKLDAIMASAKAKELTEDAARHLEGLSLSWRFFKNATFAGEFNWYSGLTDPEAATAQLIEDMKAYGIVSLSENGALSIRDEAVNAERLPTFWYAEEDSLGNDIKTETNFRVIVHKILWVLCAPLRLILGK